MIIKFLLKYPLIWDLSQMIFGATVQKKKLYSSSIKEKGKILDFGCADGNTFLAFKKFNYTGVDIDEKAIAHASKKYANFPNAKFICADILKDSLPKESFDIILFAATGHHLSDKLLFKVTKSLSKLLKKGGHLYFFDPIKDSSRKSKLLSFLISLDQGKFHRDEKFYNKNLKRFSKNLSAIYHKTFILKHTYFPQPTTYLVKFLKI